MRVPGRFFLSDELARELEEGAIRQLANVATMPGILKCALAMPDIHWGYGFPIGGVAAFDRSNGVISPGGVGFDINCGVRLVKTPLSPEDLKNKRELIEHLYDSVPTGVGAKRKRFRFSPRDLEMAMAEGASWAVRNGYGVQEDIEHCEQKGQMKEADPSAVSAKARERGVPQGGTLGSGNHFLELQEVREIYDETAAATFGVKVGQVCVMIHCGSRGLGHQVCTDYLKTLESAMKKYQITLPDRQLACAPVSSPEGKAYFGAMAAAANYAWANRQLIMNTTRKVFEDLYGLSAKEMPLLYDVAHNVAKMETHTIEGQRVPVCIHRKGATRAFGPGSEDIPHAYASIGQPVLIPGSMGSPSFLLCGTREAMERSFGSTCHGAGRVESRSQAKKELSGKKVKEDLEKRGILVLAPSYSSIAEEAPSAYKSSQEVVRVVHEVGLSRMVARLEPLGVIKG
ncbi:MAG: RtcB family protein [Methanomicrobiales archaeon]|nr:RtcB family protein [Methanomicrobiales archaeon]